MPTIYDNIEKDLLEGLKDALAVSQRGDFCVGYFNLRGWQKIADSVDKVKRRAGEPACRLIVGMHGGGDKDVRRFYGTSNSETTQKQVMEHKRRFAEALKRQVTLGLPTYTDGQSLKKLRTHLREGVLRVKFYGRDRLHAKLYLAHRDDKLNPITAFVGSSNLTFAGLQKQGELNVDVQEKDAAQKLANWFEARWGDDWCLDITDELAKILEESWAVCEPTPYEIYIKTAYELSREAIDGMGDFPVPESFRGDMLEFQEQAVSLAAQRLKLRGGVMISDVVGLGKTMVASAVAKTFQEDQSGNVLVICPPKLQEMWDSYMHKYEISGKTMSLAKVANLKNERRYRLVLLDESHNLRNRESKRHGQIADYVRANDSSAILLTATPYNKQFTDIANQLRLFVREDEDLEIRPEKYITDNGGARGFRAKHPGVLASSLAAFERSGEMDDWRDLMRLYMVRRTRSHIKNNYATFDKEKQRHYLLFPDGERRFYFPERKPKTVKFAMREGDPEDQYAKLYSQRIADGVIGDLALPRYGLGEYLLNEIEMPDAPDEKEKQVIENLNRAGKRLIGFARSGLFKRLESSGHAFMLSVRRHIVRNAVYLAALNKDGGELPIGELFGSVDEGIGEDDIEELLPEEKSGEPGELGELLDEGAKIYRTVAATMPQKYKWIKTSRFKEKLKEELLGDCRKLMGVFELVPKWRPQQDRKLKELLDLCRKTHGGEKLLIFTQFADTADYLHKALKDNGVQRIAKVTGGTGKDDLHDTVRSFSPKSNDAESAGLTELRVLITTDTLSEGQNLQDAHIIVNFDLPWAIVRLIQRAGRVDRIGQESPDILCYCFLPEDGVDKIITLRERLQARIKENADLVGADEKFFEGNAVNLEQVFNEELNLDEEDDDTDLISRCHDIWRNAVKDDDAFRRRIENMQDVVFSGKRAAKDQTTGALAYVKTGDSRHILAHVGDNGEVLTQSQSAILDMMECQPEEPRAQPPKSHHELVAVAAKHAEKTIGIGGQLGGPRSPLRNLYHRLKTLAISRRGGRLLQSKGLPETVEDIYRRPLKQEAMNTLRRMMQAGVKDSQLADVAVKMREDGELIAAVKTGKNEEAKIICSVALVKK